ncbi:alpha-galactosidase 1 [Hortaea werneckii]|nr:alpha-galactosidase 1 [Hortaea werneckii]
MAATIAAALAVLPIASGLELPNEVGKLPALGWNSWNAYYCDINQEKILQAAKSMVDRGFKDAGYTYINSDDCWSRMDGRDPETHELRPNMTKFPDGIKGTADQIHDMGFKFGIYSSAGTKTCGEYPASLGYEAIDAATFAAWGVDYLKYDNCFPPEYWYDDCLSCEVDPSFSPTGIVNGSCTNSTPPVDHYSYERPIPFCALEWPVDGVNYTAKYTALRFRIMQEALLAQNRTILYSLCEWGVDQPWRWGNQTGSSWRISNDIAFGDTSWPRIVEIINMNSFLSPFADFYGHNDADMLTIGNGNLTSAETRTHFGLWALMKSPILIGTVVANLTDEEVSVLQNKMLLSFHQDPVFGKPAAPYKWGANPDWTFNNTVPAQYWSGASSNGTMVAMFNLFNETKSMVVDFNEVPQLDTKSSYEVVNVWDGSSMGSCEGNVQIDVEAHDTAILLFTDS